MRDQRGLAASSRNPASLAAFERALFELNSYVGDPLAVINAALASDPDFALGHVLRGYVHVSLWERSAVAEVRNCVARLRQLDRHINDRERRHSHALAQWAAGDWNGMRDTLDRLSAEYPRDLLALQIGHLADFYHGDRDSLRGRIARALPDWSRADGGYGFLLGMHAFGLEECGAYAAAEEAGRHALEIEAIDSWAHHAVLHVLEMQTRQAEGIAFAESRTRHWAQPDNAFRFHNWWHAALMHLDTGNERRALEIYDEGIREDASGVQLIMLDAAALLWRMHLRGLDVGGRWEELAVQYENSTEAGFYAFNDVHAVMSFVATGRTRATAERIRAMESVAATETDNGSMTRLVGLPIARALDAFGHECYADAVDLLMPIRYRSNIFGGSHAQRDIVHQTLIEAAIRSGEKSLAIAFCRERVALRPNCPFSWRLLESTVRADANANAA